MTTRIFFNGQEYPSVDAMPGDVRKLYEQALAQLADTDHDGIPDILQGRGGGEKNVIGIESSSITVNGKTYDSVEDMPAPLRFLLDQAMRQIAPKLTGTTDAPALPRNPDLESASTPGQGLVRALDQTESLLATLLVILLSAAAGAVIVFGSWMITHMSASERSQGGALYVGLGMAVVLGAIAVQLVKLWMRRQRTR